MKAKKRFPVPREFYGWVKCLDATQPGYEFPPCSGSGGLNQCSSGMAILSGDRPPMVGARRTARAFAAGQYPKGVWECCDVGSLKLKADVRRHGRWSVDGTHDGSSKNAPVEILQFVGSYQDAKDWYYSLEGQAWCKGAISVALLKFRMPGGPKQRPRAVPIPIGVKATGYGGCAAFPVSSWGESFASHLTETSNLFDQKELDGLLKDAKVQLKVPDIDECESVKTAVLRQSERLTEIRLRKTDISALMYVVDPSGQLVNKQHTMDLIDRVRLGLLRPIFELKAHYARGRPWDCCGDLPTAIGKRETQFPWHPAFPAGHATFAHTISGLIGWRLPTLQQNLDKRAREVAEDRVIGGFHWHSDNDAGEQLAKLVVARLLKLPDILRLLEGVATEWP